ncbi:complement factor H-related protein 3-like [Acanthopagrus schlegelii]
MCLRHLGFALLLWFRGGLQARSAEKRCDAPPLTNGYFVLEQNTDAHGTHLTYACERGYKPAVEGWWATSTCQSGTWSPKPQCINQTACTPPMIPNAKYTENPDGWYEEGDKIRITCEESYELKERHATALCRGGTWISVPVCERSADACGAPPKVPHAVIVDHGYKELFAEDTELQYECEDGYTAEGAGNDKTIVCIKGAWTEGPTCSRVTDGSSGTGGGNTTSAGSRTPPAGGGSSSSSGSNTGDTERRLTTVDICGILPKIPKAVVVRNFRRSVKYGCQQYYKLLGPDSVRCYSDGTWSELPSCEASYCVVNTLEYPDLKPAGEIYLEDGETVRLECVDRAEWWFNNYSDGECDNGIIHLSRCCAKAQLAFNTCNGFLTKRNHRLPLD